MTSSSPFQDVHARPSRVHPAAVAPPAHDHGGLSSDGPDGQRRATSGDGPGTRADSLLPPGRSGGRDAERCNAPAEQRLDLLLEQSRGQLETEAGAVRHGTEGRYVVWRVADLSGFVQANSKYGGARQRGRPIIDMHTEGGVRERNPWKETVCSCCAEPVWHQPENAVGRRVVCWPCAGEEL